MDAHATHELSLLVLDKDALARQYASQAGADAGLACRFPDDPGTLLAQATWQPVAAVVLDGAAADQFSDQLVARLAQSAPEVPIILCAENARPNDVARWFRQGASDFLEKPYTSATLRALLEKHLAGTSLDTTQPVLEDQVSTSLAALALRAAHTDASIMISGESGVGKEVFARLIHEHSPRAAQPFVAINCAAIPESMLESVLFGHEKGAFTGAHTARAGKFEQANGGTLLLDEISEMDLALQAKLLRVLQEREVERLGARTGVALDIRVLATSNRNLVGEVNAGRFRQDLYYRLNVFPLQIPPLRERRADILPLCERFLAELAPGKTFSLDPFARELLLGYHWPGNIRELQNVVQRALILSHGDTLDGNCIMLEPAQPSMPPTGSSAPSAMAATGMHVGTASPAIGSGGDAPLNEDLKTLESQRIIATLREQQGNRKRTAEILGISPRTLRYKLARLRESGVIDIESGLQQAS